MGHARVTDYLGPHRVTFAVDYRGEVAIDLGPIGNAYLASPISPLGVQVTVGGVGSAAGTISSLFSAETLAAYTTLYDDPQEALRGIVEQLEADAVRETVKAEVVLLIGFAGWRLRRQLLAPWVARRVTRRRTAAVYVSVTAVVVGSILVPAQPEGTRIPVQLGLRGAAATVTVDSPLLADLVDRAVSGVTLLSDRQQASVRTYVDSAAGSLSEQLDRLPAPRTGETMVMGFSDLHCNQAITELMTRLVSVSRPSLVLDSGDDTVNGTAAERGCIRREARIAQGVPFVVATGNHDSDVTEAQMRAAGMTVLDGTPVDAAGWSVLGDDDPERQIPFSVERTRDRPETEEQLGQRMVDVARTRRTDVILVHQPYAANEIQKAPDLPARLLLWGHFHSQLGPVVLPHSDGSWTVGMQQGTAGGVKQPTITSFSTPFSAPLISADVYFYFRDDATGLITGVQPVHFLPDASVVIDRRIPTGNLAALPAATRERLATASPSPTPS